MVFVNHYSRKIILYEIQSQILGSKNKSKEQGVLKLISYKISHTYIINSIDKELILTSQSI